MTAIPSIPTMSSVAIGVAVAVAPDVRAIRGQVRNVSVGDVFPDYVHLHNASVHVSPAGAIFSNLPNGGTISIIFDASIPGNHDVGTDIIFTGNNKVYDDGQTNNIKLILTAHKPTAHNVMLQVPVNNEGQIKLPGEGTKIKEVDATGWKAGIATDWKQSQGVRVIRAPATATGGEGFKYAPNEGFRYDGIYRIVGFLKRYNDQLGIIFQFHLRRDDPSKAPWRKEGEEENEGEGYPAVTFMV
jgi:hypothetical protein